MKIVVVINPKGGVGKSTLSTQIAGYFASQGHHVMLGDTDVQGSSKHWLKARPETVAPVHGWNLAADLVINAKPLPGTSHVVIDTAGSITGWRLDRLLERADKVIIPMQPSIFDMQATHDFLVYLRQTTKHANRSIGAVGMRVVTNTISARKLEDFLSSVGIPTIGMLRDTQNYIHFAAHGLSFFDVTPSRYEKDLSQWQSICHWLDH